MIVRVLLAINLVVFATMTAMERVRPDLAESVYGWGLLNPHDLHWWGFLSYAFLHGGVLHIGFNMLFLWVFGPPVEDRFGRVGFTLFYLAGAAASGAAHVFFEDAPVLGASGAIAAVTGAFLIMFPRTQIKCLTLLGGGTVMVPAAAFIAFAIVIDLVFHGFSVGRGIARLAHLGGYAMGGATALALLGMGALPREPFDVFTMIRQARRRKVLREAVQESQHAIGSTAKGERDAVGEPDRALQDARAEVSRRLGMGELAVAAETYEALLNNFPTGSRAHTTMSRRHQLDLGNFYFSSGAHAMAAETYERYAAAYPDDRESPNVLVLAALVATRHLNDPVRARAALAAIKRRLDDPEHDALARQLQAELSKREFSQPPN